MSDKSPEMSGARDDLPISGREPVLTGHNARVLADRRGAYLAGNLAALISMMSEKQRLQFKQWNVKMMVRKSRSVLHLFEEKYPDDMRPRQTITEVERWLNAPTEEIRLTVAYRFYAAEDATEVAADPTVQAAAIAAARAAQFVAWNSPWWVVAAVSAAANATGRDGNVKRIVRRAQLRAAYIILERGDTVGNR